MSLKWEEAVTPSPPSRLHKWGAAQTAARCCRVKKGEQQTGSGFVLHVLLKRSTWNRWEKFTVKLWIAFAAVTWGSLNRLKNLHMKEEFNLRVYRCCRDTSFVFHDVNVTSFSECKPQVLSQNKQEADENRVVLWIWIYSLKFSDNFGVDCFLTEICISRTEDQHASTRFRSISTFGLGVVTSSYFGYVEAQQTEVQPHHCLHDNLLVIALDAAQDSRRRRGGGGACVDHIIISAGCLRVLSVRDTAG